MSFVFTDAPVTHLICKSPVRKSDGKRIAQNPTRALLRKGRTHWTNTLSVPVSGVFVDPEADSVLC